MQFQQLLPHAGVELQLKDMVNNNRLSHALLFLGKEGSGSLPMAIALAQYVLCERVNQTPAGVAGPSLFGEEAVPMTVKDPLPDSCGECASCIKISKLAHPDLHFSYPVIKRDGNHSRVLSTDYLAEWREFISQSPYGNVNDWIDHLKNNAHSKIESPANKQANISSKECEDILHKLSLKAFEGEYKILILWMPEFLRAEGNKLLKLIEEPPPGTLFILVAEDEDLILPTILSRTQLVKIPRYEPAVVAQFLENKGMAPQRAVRVASMCEGNVRDALLVSAEGEDDWLQQVRNWLNVTVKGNVGGQLKWIEEVSALGRDKQKQFLRYFIHLLEQALRVRYLPEEHWSMLPTGAVDFAIKLNNMCSPEAQEAMVNELDKAIYHIERNAHGKILFHALTIRLYHIIKDNSLILIH